MTLQIAKLVDESVVDGPGIRFVIFTQGCIHNCWGCHNQSTHDLYGGTDVEIDDILNKIDANPLVEGVTFSGGDPILQLTPLKKIVEEIKKRNLNILIYTGYTWEQLMARPGLYVPLLQDVDYLIDGLYKYNLRCIDVPFIGSTNQRIIDVQSSLNDHEIRLINL